MNKPGNISEEPIAEPMTAAKQNNWTLLTNRFSYKKLINNMPYLVFITFLGILYIANNNRAISLTSTINKESKVQKELKWEYLDIQSRLMFQTSESQLKLKTKAIGLLPLEKPTFEIKVKVPATS